MDIGMPVAVMTPTLEAPVLQALARSDQAMTATRIHVVMGRASYNGVVKTLRRLVEQGLVIEDRVGTTYQYLANRDHLAWPAIEVLVGMSDALEARLRTALRAWRIAPTSALMFGSAARRDGDTDSDIDILLVSHREEPDPAPGPAPDTEGIWDTQKMELASAVRRWTGNPVSILEVTPAELVGMVDRAEPIVAELRRDAITLVGPPVRELLVRPS